MNDDDLRNSFKALRDDDARSTPSFEGTMEKPPAQRPRRVWQLSLAATAAAIVIVVATQYQQRPAATRLASIDSSSTTDNWTTPSDAILADKLYTTLSDTAEHLSHEIDQLLKR